MKSDLLRVFKQARQSNLEWVVHGARLMVEIEESDSVKPILYEDCIFSRWYHEEGQYITKLPGLKRIIKFHQEFHFAYKALYYKKFDRSSSKRERKLFSKKFNKPTDSETTIRDKFEVLKLSYETLEREILALENIVSVMNEKLFEDDRIRA